MSFSFCFLCLFQPARNIFLSCLSCRSLKFLNKSSSLTPPPHGGGRHFSSPSHWFRGINQLNFYIFYSFICYWSIELVCCIAFASKLDSLYQLKLFFQHAFGYPVCHHPCRYRQTQICDIIRNWSSIVHDAKFLDFKYI